MEELISRKNARTVLFLGEGNFSFSTSLTGLWDQEIKSSKHNNDEVYNNSLMSLNDIYSTCYERHPVSSLAKGNIDLLKQKGVNVLLGIDGTSNFKEDIEGRFQCKFFDKVIFMFPHVGGKMKIKKNRDLLRDFATNIINYLNPENKDAQVVIALCGGQGGTPFDPIRRAESDTWQVIKMLSYGGLQLVSIGMFDIEKCGNGLPESYCSYGYRGINKGFRSDNGVVHVFEASRNPICSIARNASPRINYCQSRSIRDVKNEYMRRKMNQVLDKRSLIGKFLEHFVTFITSLNNVKVSLSIKLKNKVDFDILAPEFKKLEILHAHKNFTQIVTIEVGMEEDFTMDFTKCPVKTTILVKHCPNALKDVLVEEFNSGIISKSESLLTFDLTTLSLNYFSRNCAIQKAEFEDVSWQQLWSNKKSIYPPKYSHCLSFWVQKEYFHKDSNIFDQTSLAIILWCCGYDSVVSCELVDIYEEENRISNTYKVEYESHIFPLSPNLAFELQTKSIGETLKHLFNAEIR